MKPNPCFIKNWKLTASVKMHPNNLVNVQMQSKMPKVNKSRPIGETSPNLVTLDPCISNKYRGGEKAWTLPLSEAMTGLSLNKVSAEVKCRLSASTVSELTLSGPSLKQP
jgi:hypothetical protein